MENLSFSTKIKLHLTSLMYPWTVSLKKAMEILFWLFMMLAVPQAIDPSSSSAKIVKPKSPSSSIKSCFCSIVLTSLSFVNPDVRAFSKGFWILDPMLVSLQGGPETIEESMGRLWISIFLIFCSEWVKITSVNPERGYSWISSAPIFLDEAILWLLREILPSIAPDESEERFPQF